MSASKTFAEFFAGIGLVRLGLAGGGWRCVYANDHDPRKRRMHADHFGAGEPYHLGDIWDTDAVVAALGPPPTLATASFPCTDLSLAGRGDGLGGRQSSTFFAFTEVLRRLDGRRPKLLMLENVLGLLTSRGGDDFRTACGELASLGYWLDAMVVDARRFVPQSRPRVFVFGFHRSVLGPPLVAAPGRGWDEAVRRGARLRPASLAALCGQFPLATGWATVPLDPPPQGDAALADLIDTGDEQDWWDEADVRRHHDMMEGPSRGRVDRLLAEPGLALGTAFRRTRRGRMRTEVRFDVAGCLRTPKGGSARQIVVAAGAGRLRMRWMSAREYARLQGAGDYVIAVPQSQALHGFGDAVCVPAVAWLDRHVLTPVHDRQVVAVERPGAAD